MLRITAAVVAASVGIALLLGQADEQSTHQARPRSVPVVRAAEPQTVFDTRASPAGEPSRVRIPVVGVDAPVVPVRMDDGTLDPPDDAHVVGWWSAGARPGAATGTALLTAHTVHTGGGAFDDLSELTPGASLSVLTRSGTVAYVVQRVEAIDKDKLARRATRLFDQSVPGRLALVTCTDWDGEQYLSNTVVLATPAPMITG